MNKNIIITGIILIIIILGWISFNIVKNNPQDDSLLKEIQIIENKIDSLSNRKDSVRTEIITIDKEILKNEKHYETVINNVISQSNSLDSIFARDYIKKFIDERVR